MGGTIEAETPHNIERQDRAECGKGYIALGVGGYTTQKMYILGAGGHHTYFLDGPQTQRGIQKPIWLGGWDDWVVFFQEIFLLCGSIWEAVTCHILSLAENQRWSQVRQYKNVYTPSSR